MFLKLKINPYAMLEYLSGVLPEIGFIKKCFGDYEANAPYENIWDKLHATFLLLGCVVKQTTALMEEEGWSVDKAIEVGSKAVDELFEFSGIIGGLVEGFDDTICKIILKAVYELVRDRTHLTKKEFIKKAVEDVKSVKGEG